MTDYSELVKALRYCIDGTCGNCPYVKKCRKNGRAVDQLHKDAAAAIEELQVTIELMKPFMPDFFPDANKVVLPKLEPKRGEWIGKSDDDSLVKCSVCGHIRIGSSLWYCKQYVPYCENCGAKMEVHDG